MEDREISNLLVDPVVPEFRELRGIVLVRDKLVREGIDHVCNGENDIVGVSHQVDLLVDFKRIDEERRSEREVSLSDPDSVVGAMPVANQTDHLQRQIALGLAASRDS